MPMISLKYVNATQRNKIYYLATSSSNGAEIQSFIQSVFCELTNNYETRTAYSIYFAGRERYSSS